MIAPVLPCPICSAPTPYDWDRCGNCGSQRIVAADGSHAGFARLAGPWRRVAAAAPRPGAVRRARRARAGGAARAHRRPDPGRRRPGGADGRDHPGRAAVRPGLDRRQRPHASASGCCASTWSATTAARRPTRGPAVREGVGKVLLLGSLIALPLLRDPDRRGDQLRRHRRERRHVRRHRRAVRRACRSRASRSACCSPATGTARVHDRMAGTVCVAGVPVSRTAEAPLAAPAAPVSDVPAAVSTRPRGVRWIRPCWIRYGS